MKYIKGRKGLLKGWNEGEVRGPPVRESSSIRNMVKRRFGEVIRGGAGSVSCLWFVFSHWRVQVAAQGPPGKEV